MKSSIYISYLFTTVFQARYPHPNPNLPLCWFLKITQDKHLVLDEQKFEIWERYWILFINATKWKWRNFSRSLKGVLCFTTVIIFNRCRLAHLNKNSFQHCHLLWLSFHNGHIRVGCAFSSLFLRAAFTFGWRVHFALRRKMLNPPIARLPAI